MNAALGRLLFMRFRGGVRHRMSQFATPRGATFLLAAAGIVWLVLGAGAPGDGADRLAFQDAGDLRAHIADFMPLCLLGAMLFTVFTSTGPALHFSQNEVDFLFAGPFSRRSLVLYKLCAYAAGALLSAAIVTMLIPPRASIGLAAFAGSFLTLMFIQLSTAAIKTFGHAFEGSRFMRARRPFILALVACAFMIAFYMAAITDETILDVIRQFRHSWFGTILLTPFVVFDRLFLAQDMAALLGWAGCAIAMNAVLLAVIVMLYDRASENALSESRQLSNRWARMRQGASFWASDATTGRSLRRAPFAAGLGPVAWRQAINAVRNSGRTLVLFFAVALACGPLIANAATPSSVSGLGGLLYFFVAFMVPRALICDFRGELAAMELYKALPIAPWRLCAGQMVVPVVLTSALQLVAIASALPFLDGTAATVVVALAAFTVPASLLLYGVENLIFLLFPTRLLPIGRADFEFLGRTLVDFVAKTFILVGAAIAAGAAGYAALAASGTSWGLFALASWCTLGAIALSTVPLMGFAFARFKVGETIA